MTRWTLLQALAVLLCIAAGYISYNLLQKHITGSSGIIWFESVCHDDAGEGSADCDAVLASPYAYFPPKHHPDARGAFFPVAFLGLIYYSTLGVWLFGVGRLSIRRRWLHIVPLGMVVFGMSGSVYYSYIMFTQLDQWCPWCLATHIINAALLVCVLLLFPFGRPDPGDTKEPPAQRQPGARHASTSVTCGYPSARLVCTTVLAMALIAFGEAQMLGRQNFAKSSMSASTSYNRCVKVLKRIQASGRALLAYWEEEKPRDIEIRPDDPIRGPADERLAAWDVVIFSDFECPSCRNFAMFFEQRVRPLFADRLSVVFKHYPLDSSCNRRVRGRMHPHACDAMSIAEAARMVGGNDAFWKMHDYLFAMRERTHAGLMTPEDAAAAVNLDPDALRAAMSSAAIQERLDQDVVQAAACDLKGTPAVYVNGKLVDTIATLQIRFWDELANTFWAEQGTPRPSETHVPKPKLTPNTPVPVIDQ